MAVGRWFRLYDSVLDDPKVQKLPAAIFKAWVNLMCLASRHGGVIAKCWDDITFALRMEIEPAKETVSELVRAELLDEFKNRYEPHNWKERQYKSDTSTARVKRFRKRSETVAETPPEQRQNRTEQNSSSALPRFPEFWLGYPRKVGKGAAEKAWAKAIKIAETETILDRLKAYSASVAKEDPKFIPHPSTWLNEKRWEDDGLAPAFPSHTPEELARLQDQTDRIMKRGKYAEVMQ